MTTAEWVAVALSGVPVWNIGQIDKATARELDRLARRGVLVRGKYSFCNISRPKTVWSLPGAHV